MKTSSNNIIPNKNISDPHQEKQRKKKIRFIVCNLLWEVVFGLNNVKTTNGRFENLFDIT